MTNTNETSADIIAEMETERPGLMNAQLNTNNSHYARRLKVALKRERGDCAKLREALRECAQYIACVGGIGVGEVTINDNVHLIPEELTQKAIAALAAPPRNCDVVPVEAPEAADMFHRERPLHGYDYETHEWLLAPATEQEGGNDAD